LFAITFLSNNMLCHPFSFFNQHCNTASVSRTKAVDVTFYPPYVSPVPQNK
jgi:hypothetical protein